MRDVWNKLEVITLGHGNVPRYRLLESAVLDRGLSGVPREEHLEDHIGAPGKAPIERNKVLDRMRNDEGETYGGASHDRALSGTSAYEHVTSLVTEVGPRSAGSSGDAAAVRWALNKLGSLGFSNVRSQDVLVPRWVRGNPEDWAGESYHLHRTDGDGEWLVRLGPDGVVEAERAHAKGDVAVRGSAEDLWLWTTGRLDAALARHKPQTVMHFASHTLVGESMKNPLSPTSLGSQPIAGEFRINPRARNDPLFRNPYAELPGM